MAAVKVHRGCYAVVEEAVCVGCGKCAKSCPAGCIEMKGRAAV
ncbi:MAG: 4Fe-4S binding protein [Acetivibrio ethanolgignens]